MLREPVRTACGTVLEGLEGLLLGRDRLDLPAQFEAVQGPPWGATMNADIVLIRRLTADLGTRHVYPHSSQVLA